MTLRLSLVATLLALGGCVGSDQPGQTEPVAPAPETAPYPEDPDMGKASGEVDTPASPDTPSEEPAELTQDPFKKDLPAPPKGDSDGDVAASDSDGPPPDEGEDTYNGAFEDTPPKYENTPNVVPSDVTEGKTPHGVTSKKTKTKSKTKSAAGKGKTRYVNATLINVRAEPSPKATIVRRLLGGAKIHIGPAKNGWAKISDGQWIRVKYLSAKPTKKVSKAQADKAWEKSKYKDTWKP